MKRLTHNIRVLVTDGGRAMVLRNAGQAGKPDLQLVRGYGHDNPPTRDLGTGKPPRNFESMGNRRSAADAPDYHQRAEDSFVEQIAADMAFDLSAGSFAQLIVAAPPEALGVFRKAVPAAVKQATILEINKDLTRHSHTDIASIVVKALEGA